MAYRDLCRPCAEALKAEGKSVVFESGGRDHKVICFRCQRRRYGAMYKVSLPGGKPKHPKKVKSHVADHT